MLDDYQFAPDSSHRRTSFDSGEVRVSQVSARVMWLRVFDVAIENKDYENFRSWIEANGYDWFNYTDPHDGKVRDCRLRADPEYTRMDRQSSLNGDKYWRTKLSLEGYL